VVHFLHEREPSLVLERDNEGLLPLHRLCNLVQTFTHDSTSLMAYKSERQLSHVRGAPDVRVKIDPDFGLGARLRMIDWMVRPSTGFLVTGGAGQGAQPHPLLEDTDEHFQTPLIYACSFSDAHPIPSMEYHASFAIASVLCKRGANVNAQAENQETALHRAARAGAVDLCDLLYESGADPQIPNKDDMTVRDVARESRSHEMIEWCQKHLISKADLAELMAGGSKDDLSEELKEQVSVSMLAEDYEAPCHMCVLQAASGGWAVGEACPLCGSVYAK